jgi:hypothetical protein
MAVGAGQDCRAIGPGFEQIAVTAGPVSHKKE